MTRHTSPNRYLRVIAAAATACLLAATARAAPFTVSTLDDAVDVDPGDGICETQPGTGVCTLRAAIQETNALAGPDTIDLPAGTYVLTLDGRGEDEGAEGDLDVTDDLTLNGAGADDTVVSADGLDRVLHVDPAATGVSVTVSGVTWQDGRSGDLENGGAIATAGSLTVRDGVVASSRAGQAGNGVFGGGVYVSDANTGTLTLERVTVRDNRADDGAGLFLEGDAEATIVDSAIRDNVASQSAGGINNSGTLAITGSTLSGNEATQFNGGAVKQQGTLSLTNVTLSGNTAGDFGGAIEVSDFADATTFVNVTVAANEASEGGGLYLLSGATVSLANTLLAGNAGGDCAAVDPADAPSSNGGNLDSDGTCGLTGEGDLSDAMPHLGPLADNGGATRTHAVLEPSAALDAVAATCPPPDQDQRGVARPIDGNGDGHAACDIGAYEAPEPRRADLSVTKTGAPNPVAAGDALTYAVEVTNGGPDEATNVRVTDALPEGVTVMSASEGCSASERSVSCSLDALGNGETAGVEIVVRAPASAATLHNSATVSADERDPDRDDNEASEATTVRVDAGTVSVRTGPADLPERGAARPGDADVPVLQATLHAAGEDALLESLTLTASGTGHDALDIAQVNLYRDADEDGVVDVGEGRLATGRYVANDGQAVLTLDAPLVLEAEASATLLVGYDVSATLAEHPSPEVPPLAPLALLLPALLLRRARRGVLGVLALALIAACAGPRETPLEPASYRPTLTEVAATGRSSGMPVELTGLPVAGTRIVVQE